MKKTFCMSSSYLRSLKNVLADKEREIEWNGEVNQPRPQQTIRLALGDEKNNKPK